MRVAPVSRNDFTYVSYHLNLSYVHPCHCFGLQLARYVLQHNLICDDVIDFGYKFLNAFFKEGQKQMSQVEQTCKREMFSCNCLLLDIKNILSLSYQGGLNEMN